MNLFFIVIKMKAKHPNGMDIQKPLNFQAFAPSA